MSKIALITGATSGFGEACASKFAANGYDLILNGRRKDRLHEQAASLERKYNIAVCQLPFDVRDEKAVLQSIQPIRSTSVSEFARDFLVLFVRQSHLSKN